MKHGPIKPLLQLDELNGRPRSLAKPGSDTVAEVNGSWVMPLELFDSFGGTTWSLGDNGLHIPSIFWQVSQTRL
jgi:hypothetical protein